MIRFIVRRTLWAAVLLVAVTMVSYDLFFLLPSDPGVLGSRRAQTSTNLRESLDISGPSTRSTASSFGAWATAHSAGPG